MSTRSRLVGVVVASTLVGWAVMAPAPAELRLGPVVPSGIPGHDYAIDVAVTSDAVYVLENLHDEGNGSLVVRRFDHQGLLVWHEPVIGSTTPEATLFGALDADADSVYVTFLEDEHTEVRRLTADGTEVWTRSFGAPGLFTWPEDVVTRDDLVVIVGRTEDEWVPGGGGDGADAFTQALSADGEVMWTRQWGGASDDIATAVDVRGGVVAVSYRTLENGEDFDWDTVITTFDVSGARLWNRRLHLPGKSVYGTAVAISRGDVVVAAGQLDMATGARTALFVSFGETGDRRWVRTLRNGRGIAGLTKVGGGFVAVGDRVTCRDGGPCRVSALMLKLRRHGAVRSRRTFGGGIRTYLLGVSGDPGPGIVAVCGARIDLSDSEPESDGFFRLGTA